MVVSRASRLLLPQSSPLASKSVGFQLLLANGFIHPAGKGLFSLLPLGQRVVDRLTALIEQELNAIGALKLSVPILGAKEVWNRTGRWTSMGSELFRLSDRSENEFCLQPTAEEMFTQIVAQLPKMKLSSFPLLLYQTTEKFRDEMNPRFGLLRGRQFLMNDLYSFDVNEESARVSYGVVSDAYQRILGEQLGLPVYKVRADSGVHGGRLSHEYHLLNPLEEDALEHCKSCDKYHKFGEEHECMKCTDKKKISSIEIAHTFQLGTRYAEAFKAFSTGRSPLEMCCFGIGVTRLLPAIVELSTSGSAVRLPPIIAPYDVAVVPSQSLSSSASLSSLVDCLSSSYPSVLLDDRYELNIEKRIRHVEQIGVSRVIVVGKKAAGAQEEPLYEVWKGDSRIDEKVMHKGDFKLEAVLEALE